MKTYSIADKEKLLLGFLKRYKDFINYASLDNYDWHFYRHVPSKRINFLSDSFVKWINAYNLTYARLIKDAEEEIDDAKDRVIKYQTNGPKLSWQEIELMLAINGELWDAQQDKASR